MKESIQSYFTKFFENDLKNLKNTCKNIKSINFIKSSSSSPILLTYQNRNIEIPEK